MTIKSEINPGDSQNAGWRGKFAGEALIASLIAVAWFALAALGTRFGFWDWHTGAHFLIGTPGQGLGRFVAGAAVLVSIAAIIVSLSKAPRKRAFMLAFAALLVSTSLAGRFVGATLNAEAKPPLHDIQTDWSDPISPSDALFTEREATGATNPIEDDPLIPEAATARWPGLAGQRVADVQEAAEYIPGVHKSPKQTPYPLIAPLVMDASPEAAFAAALAAIDRRGWRLTLAEPAEGRIDASEENFWFGTRDDILIRIRAVDEGVRIDVRSVSRTGLSDLGANAKRVRNLLDELETRLGKDL